MNKIIAFLLSHLMFAGTMFFAAAAAPVIDAGGGEGVGDGGDDTGAEDGNTATGEGDQGTDGAEDQGNSAEATGDDLDVAKGTDLKPKPDGKVDGRQLPAKVREMMAELQKVDPKAHGFLKDALYRDRQLSQEFPGGLAEAKKFKETVSAIERDFPGGIDTVKAEIGEYRGLDEAFEKSDPRFLDSMVSANKEAFNKLMPMAMDRYAKEDSEGYQKFGASLIISSMKASGAMHTLSYLSRLITAGDREGATAELKGLTDWLTSVEGIANKPRTAAQPQNDAIAQRERAVKESEDKLWNERASAPINTFRASFIRKEAAQYIPKGQALDDDTAEAIDAQAQRYANDLLLGDDKFIKTLDAYIVAKDERGMQAFMKQKIEEIFKSRPGKPGPIERAAKLFFRGAAAPKPKPGTPGAKPGQQPGQRTQAPAQGWVKVNPPKPSEIDHSKTPFEMKMKRQAYLTNGKKVYWGTEVPTDK